MASKLARISLFMAMALVGAACSAGAAQTTSTPSTAITGTTTTEAPTSTTEAGGGEQDASVTTNTETTEPPPQVEGPSAPDFTFALADGSTFSLSGEQKPVYLVFWAEW